MVTNNEPLLEEILLIEIEKEGKLISLSDMVSSTAPSFSVIVEITDMKKMKADVLAEFAGSVGE